MLRPAYPTLLVAALLAAAACNNSADEPTDAAASAGSASGASGSTSGTGVDETAAAGGTSLEPGGGTGGAAPSMTCELPAEMGSPACDECMVGSCCGAMDACVADQECIDALHCADTCALESEDDTEFGVCLDACFGGPEPPHLLDEIFICQTDHCQDACYSGA